METLAMMTPNQLDLSFWRDRRVLVTGHTGFKGSWLLTWLKMLGAQVTGFGLAPHTQPNMFEALGLDRFCDHHQGDLQTPEPLGTCVQKARPEVVFHLAAQVVVRESYRDPVATFQTNVMGTAHLLEAARKTDSVRAVVVITSDKCYENREWAWAYRENDPMGGHDPYSASKGCAELVTAAYRRSFFAPMARPVGLCSARAGNVIGGGNWNTDGLIPDAARAFSSQNVLELRYPKAVRPWQHVLESLRGYLLLGQACAQHPEQFSQAWNFGPREEDMVPVDHVISRFASRWGTDAQWRARPPSEETPHEAHQLRLDSTLARTVLGWRPVIGLEQCLQMTADWYRAYYRNASRDELLELTLGQILAAMGPSPCAS